VSNGTLGLVVLLDALLNELKGREEDGIDDARPAHGHAQSAVHVALEELDLGRRVDLLAT